jgi:Asp-tRNA(Asn)/Glu-tRNA(Gln) amidotransferase A subunit family amidase
LRGPNGLPVGIQLVARRDRDRELLAYAQWVQRALE